ncbi:biotin transporter BioY [Amedibacillus sp. YH-ame10]
MKTKELTLCAFFTVLFVISSKVVIPVGLIPLTLQTCSLILAGVLLSPKHIIISYGLFLTMGLLGLPVFASGGGISYVLQPSFGFLLSFPVAACVISILRTRFHIQSFYQLLPVCLFGILIVYFIGCAYMYGILNFYMGVEKDIIGIISIGAAPFVISDSISTALGCICGLRLAQIPVVERMLHSA